MTMSRQDKAMTEAISSDFFRELRELIKKYDLHAGFFSWMLSPPEEDEHMLGAASVMQSGCPSCSAHALAISVLNLREDLKFAFSEAISSIDQAKSKKVEIRVDDNDKVH